MRRRKQPIKYLRTFTVWEVEDRQYTPHPYLSVRSRVWLFRTKHEAKHFIEDKKLWCSKPVKRILYTKVTAYDTPK